MAHIEDRWTAPGPTGRRVKTDRHGQGKRWRAVWTEPGGKRRRESFTTKDAATAKLARVHTEIQGGTYIRPTTTTVAEFGDRWITTQLHHRGSTQESVESRWRLHIRPTLGRYPLRDVTRDMVQDAVAAWAETLAPPTIRGVYAYASAMFRAAVEDRLIPATPCRGIRLPAMVKTRVVPLTVTQVHNTAERLNARYRAMVWTAAATGVRPSELRGITVDRLRFHPGGVVVTVDRQLATTAPTWGPPKTDTSVRDIPCDRETADMLTRHIAEFTTGEGLLFTNRAGRPISRSGLAKLWHIGTVGVALPDRSGWHALRHFHASVLIAAGLSPVAVAARLGHKDTTETLRTYAHLWHDDDDRAQLAVGKTLWPPHSPRLRVIAGQGHVG